MDTVREGFLEFLGHLGQVENVYDLVAVQVGFWVPSVAAWHGSECFCHNADVEDVDFPIVVAVSQTGCDVVGATVDAVCGAVVFLDHFCERARQTTEGLNFRHTFHRT